MAKMAGPILETKIDEDGFWLHAPGADNGPFEVHYVAVGTESKYTSGVFSIGKEDGWTFVHIGFEVLRAGVTDIASGDHGANGLGNVSASAVKRGAFVDQHLHLQGGGSFPDPDPDPDPDPCPYPYPYPYPCTPPESGPL